MIRKTFALFLIILTLSALAAACGGEEEPAPTEQGQSQTLPPDAF